MSAPQAAPPGLRERVLRLWEWFFPPEAALPAEASALLRTLYPGLRLDRVRFHLGLPHLVRLTGAEAITLPALLAARRVRIYVQPRAWSPASIAGLGTLVHEAFHALQVQESAWGFGPFRPFLWLYFACGAANGFRYHGHGMEDDAYALAGRGSSAFECELRHAFGAGGEGEVDLAHAAACAAPLARESAGLAFWRRLAASTPGVGRLFHRRGPEPGVEDRAAARMWAFLASPLVSLWLALWIVVALLAWLGLALAEGVGLLVAGPPRLLFGRARERPMG